MNLPARFLFSVLLLALIAAITGTKGSAQRPDEPGYRGSPDVEHATIGVLPGDPLERLGLARSDLRGARGGGKARYLGMTRFLNKARAVVTGTLDDSTDFVPKAIDVLDKYGIKATIAVSTQREPISRLWPRLQQAVQYGHEIGSHSRRHQCQWPDTESFCREAYSLDEIGGSREDILANTDQPYVWSWVYPCGNCAEYEFIHRRLAQAGYLVARNYPDERRGGVLVPDLQTWAPDPYNASFTQVAQKRGGIAPAGRTEVAELNAKFDEVYKGDDGLTGIHRWTGGGIYHFMSHPQWLDYGPDDFFARHLAHLAGRPDVWYVPMGPLYAYQVVRGNTVASPIKSKDGWERLAVYNSLDPKIYDNCITLEFSLPAARNIEVRSAGKPILEREPKQLTDRWNVESFRREGDATLVTLRPNTILEFRFAD